MAKVVALGDESGLENKLVVACFNKYFNEAQFGKQFNKEHNLEQIVYSKSMLVEIFLGKQNGKKSIENISIKENRNNIQVYYEVTESGNAPNGYSPYVIVETEKSKNQIQFYENGILLGNSTQNIYVK